MTLSDLLAESEGRMLALGLRDAAAIYARARAAWEAEDPRHSGWRVLRSLLAGSRHSPFAVPDRLWYVARLDEIEREAQERAIARAAEAERERERMCRTALVPEMPVMEPGDEYPVHCALPPEQPPSEWEILPFLNVPRRPIPSRRLSQPEDENDWRA